MSPAATIPPEQALAALPGVVVRVDEPLARHTALRIGGPCDRFVVVHRREALADAWEAARALGPVTWWGEGTRKLVRDGGLAGAVLRLGTAFARIERAGEGSAPARVEPARGDAGSADPLATATDGTVFVEVGAAVPAAALAGWAVARGLSGVEHLAGSPGSVGAALALDPWPDGMVDAAETLKRGRFVSLPLARARKGTSPLTGARLRLRRAVDAELDALLARAAAARVVSPRPAWKVPPSKGKKPVDPDVELRKAGLADVRLRDLLLPAVAPRTLVNLGAATARDVQLLHQSATDRVKLVRGLSLPSALAWTGTHRRSS